MATGEACQSISNVLHAEKEGIFERFVFFTQWTLTSASEVPPTTGMTEEGEEDDDDEEEEEKMVMVRKRNTTKNREGRTRWSESAYNCSLDCVCVCECVRARLRLCV